MPDQKLIDECNELLLREFGRGEGDRPNYRVIWSTGVTEKRFGEFNDFYGHILVRRAREVREVLKYPYDQDRYIFERLEHTIGNPELVEPYSYEPIYVFKDKRGFFLPLNRKVIEFYINAIKRPPTPGQLKAQHQEELEAEEKKEVEEFLEILDDVGRSPLFAYEDSVFLDSTKQKGRG